MIKKSTLEQPNLEMAQRFIEIAVDVDPYILRYIGRSYIIVNPKTLFGDFILKILEPTPPAWRPPVIDDDRKLILRIPEHIILKEGRGNFLCERKKLAIRRSLQLHFWQDLYRYTHEQRREFGTKELPAIRAFRKKNNISEDDLREESMYRRYKRLKKLSKSSFKTIFMRY